MSKPNRIEDAKAKVSDLLNQAQESVRGLRKEAVSRAKRYIKIPSAKERQHLVHSKIQMGLKKVGIASQAEVDELHGKIKRLEASNNKPHHGN